MRRIQSIGSLNRQWQNRFVAHRTTAYAMLERHPVQELHHDERTIDVPADFVNGADIRMVEGRGGTRLAAETFQDLRVLLQIVGQKLQRNETAQLQVLGFIHHTHPATAELLDDAIVRDGLADHTQACYGGSGGKSMKPVDVPVFQEGCCRSIAFSTHRRDRPSEFCLAVAFISLRYELLLWRPGADAFGARSRYFCRL